MLCLPSFLSRPAPQAVLHGSPSFVLVSTSVSHFQSDGEKTGQPFLAFLASRIGTVSGRHAAFRGENAIVKYLTGSDLFLESVHGRLRRLHFVAFTVSLETLSPGSPLSLP
jgi:hypothetical protein